MRPITPATLPVALLATLLTLAMPPLASPARAELVPEQNGADIAALLAPHGYAEVEVLRRHIDRVEAEACREGARWRVTLTLLSGRARATERLGACVVDAPLDAAHSGVLPPWSEEDAAMRALERVGYTGVRMRKWGREGWRGTACREGSLREVRVSADLRPATPLRAMRPCPEGREAPRDLTLGPPEPPIRSLRDVKERLVARGYRDVGRIEVRDGAFHATACERGWRFRITVVPAGDVRGRRNLGRCDGAADIAAGATLAGASD